MLKDKNKMYARLERNKNWVQSQDGGGGVQQYSGVCRIVKKEWGLRRLQRRRWVWVKPVQTGSKAEPVRPDSIYMGGAGLFLFTSPFLYLLSSL